jgi:hypothetical protein
MTKVPCHFTVMLLTSSALQKTGFFPVGCQNMEGSNKTSIKLFTYVHTAQGLLRHSWQVSVLSIFIPPRDRCDHSLLALRVRHENNMLCSRRRAVEFSLREFKTIYQTFRIAIHDIRYSEIVS